MMKKTHKKFLAALAVLLTVLTLLPSAVFAAVSYPKHENYVADDAGILDENTISEIRDTNKKLAGDIQMTIAVCTVNNTYGEDIGTYARNLFTEWKLGEGILILIAKDDNNYYFVPSVGVEDILPNETIASIRDEYFEADFADGQYSRAVKKVVTRLYNTLVAGVSARNAAAAEAAEAAETNTENAEEKGTPAGNAIVTFFKVILWIVILAAVLFIAVFVWAMFNDDVAALLQKYIFQRKSGGRSPAPQDFYDERLYGSRNPNPQARRRPNPNPNAPRPNQNGRAYPQNSAYPANSPNRYPQQGGYYQQNGYPANPNRSAPAQQQTYGNSTGYGYPQQPYGNGYSQQPQGYPRQQNPNRQTTYPQQSYGTYGYPQQQPNGQNPNLNRSNSGGSQNSPDNDATVQFNIPRRN
ncbi:MAG: TPM domain-containing protein [Eubacteriales bacterium]